MKIESSGYYTRQHFPSPPPPPPSASLSSGVVLLIPRPSFHPFVFVCDTCYHRDKAASIAIVAEMMAIGFAAGTRGADHNRSGAYEADFSQAVDRRSVHPESAYLAVESEDRAALMDSLILCKFLRGVFGNFFEESAEILKLVTGWDVTAAELKATAQQIVNSKKQFNILAGWTPAEDTLPERMLQQALPDDPRASLSADRLRALVKAYNLARGWSEEGWLDITMNLRNS